MELGFQSCLQIFPSAEMEITKKFYENIGFNSTSYLESSQPHICLYRDAIEIVLTKSKNDKIVPNREVHGYGYDAYFITTNQREIYDELISKKVKIIKKLKITDYSNHEFIFEDNESRWIAVGCKQNSDVMQDMQLQHVSFNCSNIKVMESFYTEKLGFSRSKVFNPGEENEFFILRKDNVRVELFNKKNKNINDNKFKHFAISVASLENTINHCNKINILVDNVIDYSTSEQSLKVCFIKDPEGNVIEFMEGYSD